MNNKYTRSFLYAVLMISSWYLGTLRGRTEQTHLCATFTEFNKELVIDSSLTLHTEEGEVITILRQDELNDVMKDSRLSFHACKR